jgi:glucose 1-dehydrogenase
MQGIRGKNVLVTGGSSGIGQAIAVRFGEEGANVAINYRKGLEEAQHTEQLIREKLDGAVDSCMQRIAAAGGKTLLAQADVSKEDDIRHMFGQVLEAFGGLDVLINNAGFQISAPTHEHPTEAFDRVLATNLRGAFLCAREAVRHFLDRGRPGVIINISSVHQLIPKPSYVGYSVSKGGMQNLTRTLALEYAAQGIRVNAVAPGATITPINRAWVDDPVKRAAVESHIPLRRAGTAEEMAAVTAFLASDEAAYITGQTIFVDGGLTLFADFLSPWSSE